MFEAKKKNPEKPSFFMRFGQGAAGMMKSNYDNIDKKGKIPEAKR